VAADGTARSGPTTWTGTVIPPETARDCGERRVAGEAAPDVGAAGLASAPGTAGTRGDAGGLDAADVFPLSVASGGPTPTGVVCWTRVAPGAYDPDRPLSIEVARPDDESFANPVVDGAVPPERVGPAFDHTVRVDLDGALAPWTRYRYRFRHRGVASPVGRCRTLPRPDAELDRLRLGVLACQDYENGYYPALGAVAAADVDFLVHLGDFIYESAAGLYRGLGSDDYPDRDVSLPSGNDRAFTLADFRHLHRLYRSDRFLRAALREHTLVAGWDDHGVANNRYYDYEADAPRAPGHPRGDDPEFMRGLTRDGVRAWYEYLPTRVRYEPDAPLLESFRLYRHLRFGTLADLLLTDGRLYRDGPPPGTPTVLGESIGRRPAVDPDRSMLGDEQREWFLDRLRGADATWTVWANNVLAAPLRVGVGPLAAYPKLDSWDGFAAERREILATAAAAGRRLVTLTGDMHSYVGARLRLSDARASPDDRAWGADGNTVGVEFMTPAVTSVNVAEAVGVDEGLLAGLTRPLVSGGVPAMNPHVDFFDSHRWGYSVVEFTPERVRYEACAVDKRVDDDAADRERVVALSTPVDRPTLRRR
jgi:alkaline phosphatase D